MFGRDGEYDRQGMRDLIRRGEVTSLTDVTLAGSDEWKSAGMYPELQRYLALASTPKETPKTVDHHASTKQIVVATILVVVGLFFAIPGLSDLYRGVASMSWPAAEAQLLQSEVVRRSSSYRRRYRSRRRQEFRATYRYMVDGRRYLGSQVSFGTEWLSTANSQMREARQGPLRIYYKPGLPRIAVMRRGPTAGAAINVILGLLGIGAGALMLFKPDAARGIGAKISELSKVRLRS